MEKCFLMTTIKFKDGEIKSVISEGKDINSLKVAGIFMNHMLQEGLIENYGYNVSIYKNFEHLETIGFKGNNG